MKFFVFGQNLRAAQRIIASGTARVLTADFRFSPEWDGMRKYAHFEQGDKKYPVPILGNRISESANLNLGQGVWEVWVHGNRFDDDENFERITTVKAKISVDPSGLCGDPLPIEPPSFGEQLDERLSVLEAGGGGTADHSKLTNREQPDQHPMEAITGLAELRDKINAFLDADDSTLDQLTELIQAIKANQGTIEQLTNGKVNVSDIVNDLTTGGANKVLSAEMGKELKRLIDTIEIPNLASQVEAAQTAAREAGQSASNAAGSASAASGSADTANAAAGRAEAAESGANSAAETARGHADSAGQSAITAQEQANRAKKQASAAAGSAQAATSEADRAKQEADRAEQATPKLEPLTLTGAASGIYDGTKPVTVEIPQGGSGSDISLGVTGASIGQIVEIEEVDENGKPTKWKAAAKPSGGGSGRILYEATVAEDVTEYYCNFDTVKGAVISIMFMGTPKNESEGSVIMEPLSDGRPDTGVTIRYAARPRGSKSATIVCLAPSSDKIFGVYTFSQDGSAMGNRIKNISGLKLRADGGRYIAAGTIISVREL